LETLGSVKTISEFLQETHSDLKDGREKEAPTKLEGSEEAKDVDCANSESFEAKTQQIQVSSIWDDDPKRNLIEIYILKLKNEVNFYVDSASRRKLQVDGGSMPLLFSSFDDASNENNAIQCDLICPISNYIMHDPVKCSDAKTYERDNIEKWFQLSVINQGSPSLVSKPFDGQGGPTAPLEGRVKASFVSVLSPLTGAHLMFDAKSDVPKLWCESNEETLAKIQIFKQEKQEENARRKKEVEGDEVRRIMFNRYGFGLQDSTQEDRGLQIDSTDMLLTWMVMRNSVMCCLCMTGPPASGKTVTMFRYDCIAKIENGLYPLLPLFMRAAELSRLLLKEESRIKNLRELICLFLSAHYSQEVVDMITTLFDLNQLLKCIDGLDEAALHQERIECIVCVSVSLMRSSRSDSTTRISETI